MAFIESQYQFGGFDAGKAVGLRQGQLKQGIGLVALLIAGNEVDEGELRAFLGEHLAKFEIPRYISFTREALPRIASGKIFKRGIREEAVARLMG